MRRAYWLGSGLAVALALSGCASSGIDLPGVGAAPRGESVVFGRVEAEGQLMAKAPIVAPGSTEVSVWDLDRGVEIATAELGDFYWHLPPGRYAIMHYREDRSVTLIVVSQHKSQELRIAAEFEVPAEPAVLYLGTLHIKVYDDDKVTKRIADDYDGAVAAFRAKYPRATGDVTKSLLQFEK